MKKSYFFILLFVTSTFIFGQRGIKIGYIDTEYILENLPEYNQISKRLEEKAGDWKKEIEERSRKIDQKKESLKSERILLTSEMIEEIEEEILIDEEELSEYQQKRFGPRGDLIIQKQQLIQPIQDQIFNAIRELAKSRNYDFIFDKLADIVMLYSDKRYDVSDQILRTISRANNRKKVEASEVTRVHSVYVVDNDDILLGRLSLKDLLVANPKTKIKSSNHIAQLYYNFQKSRVV